MTASATSGPTSEQPVLPFGEPPIANRGLFADHFLKARLRELPDWEQSEGLEEVWQRLRAIYRAKSPSLWQKANEAQTEEEFVQPVLQLLWADAGGACYKVQPRIPGVEEQRQPDYAFFRSRYDLEGAEPRLGELDYWRDAPVLGDAKRWKDSLDKQRAADHNPSAQVGNYLYRSRVRWGILTNGRLWRLYEHERSRAGGIYFEVDLEEILRHNQPQTLEHFKYFYLFFRRQAFVATADRPAFVEQVFQGSITYAATVGDRLKESVYDALRLLMNGFLAHTANRLDRNSPEAVREVHQNCLIVLYRLLFVLYAEDRGLLPCEDSALAEIQPTTLATALPTGDNASIISCPARLVRPCGRIPEP